MSTDVRITLLFFIIRGHCTLYYLIRYILTAIYDDPKPTRAEVEWSQNMLPIGNELDRNLNPAVRVGTAA